MTGPGNFEERYRSGDCTGTKTRNAYMDTFGQYRIRVSITPPNGGEAVVEEITYQLIPYGA